MLKRFACDFPSLLGRESIAERDLKISDGDVVVLPIKKTQQRSGCSGNVITGSS
jgi:hypothetical protein